MASLPWTLIVAVVGAACLYHRYSGEFASASTPSSTSPSSSLTPLRTRALVIVDVQNDFVHADGAFPQLLGHYDATPVVQPINELLRARRFDRIYVTQDWHPPGTIGFHSRHPKEPIMSFMDAGETLPLRWRQQVLPDHCVQHTWGAQFYETLAHTHACDDDHDDGEDAIATHNDTLCDGRHRRRKCTVTVVQKGVNSEVDQYSVFYDVLGGATTLPHLLHAHDVDDLVFVGVGLDYQLKVSALHAVERWQRGGGHRDMDVHAYFETHNDDVNNERRHADAEVVEDEEGRRRHRQQPQQRHKQKRVYVVADASYLFEHDIDDVKAALTAAGVRVVSTAEMLSMPDEPAARRHAGDAGGNDDGDFDDDGQRHLQ